MNIIMIGMIDDDEFPSEALGNLGYDDNSPSEALGILRNDD